MRFLCLNRIFFFFSSWGSGSRTVARTDKKHQKTAGRTKKNEETPKKTDESDRNTKKAPKKFNFL